MSDPRRLRDGAATTAVKKKLPAPRGLSAVSRIAAALSLARIVLINVLALGVTAAVTAHVLTRPSGSRPAAAQASSAAAAAPMAPAASTGAAAAAPIEVDLDRAAPAVTSRVPTAPTVNEAAGSRR